MGEGTYTERVRRTSFVPLPLPVRLTSDSVPLYAGSIIDFARSFPWRLTDLPSTDLDAGQLIETFERTLKIVKKPRLLRHRLARF